MKAKLSKKLLSIGLSVLMAVSVLPLSLISTNAVTCNIKISNITYPRPDAKPDHNIKYSGNLKYELLGTVWSSTTVLVLQLNQKNLKISIKLFSVQ
jgi:hypothetical protein